MTLYVVVYHWCSYYVPGDFVHQVTVLPDAGTTLDEAKQIARRYVQRRYHGWIENDLRWRECNEPPLVASAKTVSDDDVLYICCMSTNSAEHAE